MSLTVCQAEEYSYATGTLAHECRHKSKDEKLPRRGADASPNTS